ncbi:hypothetical protein AFK68_29525 [Hydrocoleum sp. CS-953]|uniref:hypothetical protein n=1 Tax=Hydrocoleum sp. CS-953 TaxID=1671698 RepID=UPI000B9A9E0E|nr:hypothetical protein [Hydrocoleum sp. CS-953]OZH51655.1 hypothetical protein AFK68_29525 [Hydrocoleum sp. CS-953]
MTRQIWGCVNANGSIHSGSIVNGSYNFVVSKIDVGVYEIDYDTQFSSPPVVVLTQNYKNWNDFGFENGWPADNAVLIAGNENKCKVLTGSGQNHLDRNFTFIAMGDG